MKKRVIIIGLTLFILTILVILFNRSDKMKSFLGRVDIVCFGDSITKGDRSLFRNDFPYLLAKKLNARVINAGVSGNTTRHALERIEKDVLQLEPRLVIVEFSINDFLTDIPIEETFENLDKIVTTLKQNNIIVVLVEIKISATGNKYSNGFKQLAEKRGVTLISDVMRGISSNRSLMKSDMIHPNITGQHIMSDRIFKIIKPLFESYSD